MKSSVALFALLLGTAASAVAQDEPRGGLNLGVDGYGLSIGNSKRWNGLRINFQDRRVEYVNGINITIWSAKESERSRYNGMSVGLGPVGNEFNGVTLGILGAVGHEQMRGINIGGLGLVSNADLSGLNIGGLGTVANRDMKGISIGGLGTVANRDMYGVSIAGLGTVANRDLTGIVIGGLGVVANGKLHGIALSGLGVVGNAGVTGLAVGGLGVVSTGAPFRGIGISVGTVEAREGVYGIAIAGFRVRAKFTDLRGLIISAITNRSGGLTGVAIGGYNDIRGVQRGLTIGLFNTADELHGVQLGLLNQARNNRGIFRILPLINLHLN